MLNFSEIKKKAHALFDSAVFISHIENDAEYKEALALMDELIEDYKSNRALIEVLSVSIETWEDSADEFQFFNHRVKSPDPAVSTLKLLMEQHNLGVADLPEIGHKSLVSRILNGERRITRDHITVLSNRFGTDPSLFF